jgi:hypothetical protein
MQISDAEKLILVMLSDIHEHLKIEGDIDPKFVKSAIYSGNTWGFEWEFTGIFQGQSETPQIVREVVDILEMWSMIETYYERLSSEDKQFINVEAHPYGTHVHFRGFDGNNEGEYMSIARFLIDDLNRFTNFKGRELNSHVPMLDRYQSMLEVYQGLRPQIPETPWTAAQIVSLLKQR